MRAATSSEEQICATPFMPDILNQIEREIEWMGRRLQENR
jgi:hypothetical protein